MNANPASAVDVDALSEVPLYWRKLLDPSVGTIFITGCGGGFDFVHSMTIIPILMKHGKKIVIGSNSFGFPNLIQGGELYWGYDTPKRVAQPPVVYTVNGSCKGPAYYCPEVGLCTFLDDMYPAQAPHSVYAYYARAMTIPAMTALYEKIVEEHSVDAIVTMDGGSDSLMAGNEAGLGDPLEDATSLAAISRVSNPRVRAKVLICIGVGCDRFNGVSDSATLRAVAELTRAGAFYGCTSLPPEIVKIYESMITHMEKVATFNSVIANAIVAAGNGAVGSATVPPSLRQRVVPGQLYLWPFMAMHFAFDVQGVVNRSLLIPHIEACRSPDEQEAALRIFRLRLGDAVVEEEEIPQDI